MFSTIGLADQLSEARVQPGYADEVLRWRAALRPFLCPDGVLLTERSLQSMTADVTIAESAADIIPEGIRRQKLLCNDFLQTHRFVDATREDITPVVLTGEEERFYADDLNKSVRKLKAEFVQVLGLLPETTERKELQMKFNSAKRRLDFVECLRGARNMCVNVIAGGVLLPPESS